MRQGEILSLEWDAIDFPKQTALLTDTKNGESRCVPLSTKALEALRSIPRPVAGGKVFKLTQDCLIKVFARSCKSAREKYLDDCRQSGQSPSPGFLENLRFHDLRHEGTSQLFEKRLDMMEVASVTGHKSLAMLKRYTHLRAEDLAKKLG
jgi:integrase